MNNPARDIDRRLPVGDEIFLDHVGHFVADPAAASQALARAGFAPTPISVQVNPDPAGGPPRATGTGNVTAMLDRGYLEVLFKAPSLTLPRERGREEGAPLVREFDAAMARYRGVHLAAFAVADAAVTHTRLAQSGFRTQPLVAMQRPVRTADGEDIAAFSIVRLTPGEMPEGRIQALTHRTEHAVWQPRWLTHKNGARALLDAVIAETDLDEAAARFRRFLGREPRAGPFGPVFRLERGRVQLVTADALARLFPNLVIPGLPFMAGYAIAVDSLDKATAALRAGGVDFERNDGCLTAPFPDALGIGCWVFVEDTGALPWRR
jgi:hypothetical protein